MKEIWKRYEDTIYYISNRGRAFSTHKKKAYACGIMKPWSDGHGYLVITIKKKKIKMHILVATLFIEEKPSPLHQVNHKDFNTENNDVDNLEWVTPKENIKHLKNGKGIGNQFSKKKKVAQYTLNGDLIKTFNSELEGAVELGIKSKRTNKFNSKGIKDVCEMKQNTSFNFIWRYFDDTPKLKIVPSINKHPLQYKIKMVRIDDNKEYIFESVTNAEKTLKIDRRQIGDCANGKQPTVHGFKVYKL